MIYNSKDHRFLLPPNTLDNNDGARVSKCMWTKNTIGFDSSGKKNVFVVKSCAYFDNSIIDKKHFLCG